MQITNKGFLTTKKGSKKGTKDVYIVKDNGDVTQLGENIVAVVITPKFPVHGVSVLSSNVLVISPENIVVDTLHSPYIIPESELENEDKVELELLLDEHNNSTCNKDKDVSGFEDMLMELNKSLGGEFKIHVVGRGDYPESIKEFTDKVQEEPVESAVSKMESLSKLIQDGKLTDEVFRKHIPKGSMTEFAKQLSKETGDSMYYQIATTLETLQNMFKVSNK